MSFRYFGWIVENVIFNKSLVELRLTKGTFFGIHCLQVIVTPAGEPIIPVKIGKHGLFGAATVCEQFHGEPGSAMVVP